MGCSRDDLCGQGQCASAVTVGKGCKRGEGEKGARCTFDGVRELHMGVDDGDFDGVGVVP